MSQWHMNLTVDCRVVPKLRLSTGQLDNGGGFSRTIEGLQRPALVGGLRLCYI